MCAGSGPVEAVEYQVHWACGGKRAVEAYFDEPSVRAAIHVTPTALKKWTMETDLNYTCSVHFVPPVPVQFAGLTSGRLGSHVCEQRA